MDKQKILEMIEAKKAELEDFKAQKCAKNVEYIELKRKAEAALKDGDIERALDIQNELRRVNTEISSIDARHREAEKDFSVILDAWEEYHGEYVETYKKAVAKLEKAREALKKAFFDVLEPQNEALLIMDAMRSAGIKPGELQEMLSISDAERTLSLNGSNTRNYPEIAFLYSVGLLKFNEVPFVRTVTNYRSDARHVDRWEMTEEDKKLGWLFYI